MLPSFLAIDFETANRSPKSACAIALVRVEHNRIVKQQFHLIRQDTTSWPFSSLHGISRAMVQRAALFRDIWERSAPMRIGCAFIVAHNARFDARVLRAACVEARITPPRLPYLCSLMIARDVLSIEPSDLASVSRALAISLHHHHALSDAEAAARIVLIAAAQGWQWNTTVPRRSRAPVLPSQATTAGARS